MRIGFAGAHRTGKTTLIETLAGHLPGYEVFDEPYWLLEHDGYEFSHPPTRGDFVQQLRRSIDVVTASPPDALLDRTPVDYLAYLSALGDVREPAEAWAEAVGPAMAILDLVVVVPIEHPDRIVLSTDEDRRLRGAVDDAMLAMLLEDSLDLGLDAIEVVGDVDARVRQVLRAISR
jgi:predicted ATPase